jgi:hypothetical protein
LSSLALLRHQRRLLPATRWAFLPHAHMRDETLARALYAVGLPPVFGSTARDNPAVE